MIDFHCHILPEVDDGASSLDEALAMARIFAQDGITHIVATPHCHRYIHLLRDDIIPRVSRLNQAIQSADIPLAVFPGSEIQVTDTLAYRREYEAGLYCHFGDQRDFTLLEFNWSREQYPADAPQLIAWLCGQGTTPIIAHPERMSYFVHEPSLLQALVGAGAWIQITVDSLLGNHGPTPRAQGHTQLQSFANAVLATDSHNLKRISGLSAGFAWVAENLGQDRADDILNRGHTILSMLSKNDLPAERKKRADAMA